MSIRADRVASVILRSLAQPINNIASENNAGLVTVTSVKLSNDLRIAKVYISIYGKNSSPGNIINLLELNKGHLRSLVGSAVRLRSTPELKFFVDDTLDEMEHIQDLLKSVKDTTANKDYKIDDYDNSLLPEE